TRLLDRRQGVARRMAVAERPTPEESLCRLKRCLRELPPSSNVLEHAKLTALLQHAPGLCQGALLVGYGAEHERQEHGVGLAIAERQLVCGAGHDHDLDRGG